MSISPNLHSREPPHLFKYLSILAHLMGIRNKTFTEISIIHHVNLAATFSAGPEVLIKAWRIWGDYHSNGVAENCNRRCCPGNENDDDIKKKNETK